MQEEIRKSGIAVIGNVPWGTHFCQFYQTRQDLIDTLVPYFKAGLENNEFCMWVTADNLTVEEARKAMSKAMKGFTSYLKKGQIEILTYTEWYLRGGTFNSQDVLNGWIEKLQQALKKGYDGLRLTGNTFWLENKDWHNFTEYEASVNSVIGKYKIIALCTYYLDKCGATEIVDVIRNHEFALIKQNGRWELFESGRYKDIKEELKENEKRFRLALKNAPVTVAAQDNDLRFRWAYNQRTVRPEEVLGKNDFEVFPKHDAEKLTALKRRVLQTGESINEKMWITSSGKKVYLDLFLEPTKDQDGKIIGVEVATVDLTKQKLMEDALQESEEKYRRLFESMSEGLALCEMIYDSKGKALDYRFLNINPVFEKFIGLPKEQIIGQTIQTILPNVQPKAIETFGKVVATGEAVHFENYSRDLNTWFEVYAYKSGPGQFAYLVVDITARKQVEEERQKFAASVQEEKDKLTALLNSIPDEVWFADTDKNFTLANPSALKEFGYGATNPIDIEAIAQNLEVLRPDGTPRPVNEAPPLRALKGEVVNNLEEIVRTPSTGELRYRQVNAAPVKDAGGNMIGAVSVVRDITGQKKAENALKESEERFRVLSEASPVIISVTRVSDGIVLYVNKSYSASLGYEYEDLIGKPALNVYYDPAERKAMIDKLNEQGFLQNHEIRVKKADGTPFWASASVRFINFGGERAIIAAALDISERKQAEAELVHLASFPELNPNPIAELEENGGTIYLNPAAKAIFPELPVDGLKHPFLAGWNELMKIIKNSDNQSITRQINVGQYWYLQTIIYVPKTNHFHIYGRNITERKKTEDALLESENLLRSFFDSPGLMRGIVEIVDDNTVRHIRDNAVTAGFIGLTPEALQNKLSSELGEPPDIIRIWVNHYRESQRTGKPITFEYFDQRGDTKVWLSATVSYLRDNNSGQPRFAYVVQDVTEPKKMEETLLNNEKRFRLLSEINGLLLNSEQPERVIKIIAEKVMAYLNCDAFFNFIVDESKGRLKLNAYAGIPPEAAAEIEWLDFGTAICGCVARDNQPIVSVNVQENGDERASLVRSYGIKAYASYPLRIGEKIMGTVSFGTRARTSFTYDELNVIEIVADQIAVAMRRKRAEEELKESEERFSKAFNSSPAALSISRISDGTFVDINRSFEQLFGYTRQELVGRQSTKLNIYNNPAERAEIVRLLEQNGTVHNYEISARTKTGAEIKVLTSAEKIEINGQIHIIWTTIDISEREQAEFLLRETSNYLNNLFDYANAPIIVWDSHFRISRFNPAFERLTGYKSSDVIGLDLGILFPENKKTESLELIRLTLAGERWEVVEIPILRADGEIRTVLWNSANVYDTDGKTIIATIAQGQDITERKKVEESLKESGDYLNSLIDFANAPIIVWDTHFRISRFNPAFERLTGYKARDVLGLDLDILFPEKKKTESLELIRLTLAGERWEVVEIPILRVDGAIRTVLWNSANVYDTSGKTIIATIAQGQDITERKQAEEEVKELNEKLKHRAAELEVANKELEAFSYSVSHDLRAPLRSMEGFSQALLEDCKDIMNDECQDYLRRIQDSAELMAQLIDDMLRLSRITRADMVMENINLTEMARTIAAELKKDNPERKVNFIIAPGITAYGDEKLLSIVLENLFENAWKFSGKNPEAKIEFGVSEQEGRKVYFVHDNGVGFDMTYVDKLFKPFQRLHSTVEFPGTGIGLASVQRVIQRHAGKIWTEGKIGEGATFYFTLG